MGNSVSKSEEGEEISESDNYLVEELDQLNSECKLKKIPYYFLDQHKLSSLSPIFIAYESKYENTHDVNTQRYIIKLIPNETEYDRFRIQQETNVISRLSNEPNFLHYIDQFDLPYKDHNYRFLVTKYYENSDLYEYSTKNDQLTEDDKCYIIYQMLKILQLLKNRKIIHNDIKLENFIMKSASPPTILLTDFDFAEIINKCSCHSRGTIPYMAPEVLYDEPHDYEADIWSLGICTFFLLFKSFPFNFELRKLNDKSKILSCIENNELIKPNNVKVSDDAWECVCEMLKKDQTDRITVEKALELNWFKNMKYSNFAFELNEKN